MSCATNATLPADQLGPWLTAALELANGRHATIFLFALSPLLALTMPKTVSRTPETDPQRAFDKSPKVRKYEGM